MTQLIYRGIAHTPTTGRTAAAVNAGSGASRLMQYRGVTYNRLTRRPIRRQRPITLTFLGQRCQVA